jgi:hypothetical protein
MYPSFDRLTFASCLTITCSSHFTSPYGPFKSSKFILEITCSFCRIKTLYKLVRCICVDILVTRSLKICQTSTARVELDRPPGPNPISHLQALTFWPRVTKCPSISPLIQIVKTIGTDSTTMTWHYSSTMRKFRLVLSKNFFLFAGLPSSVNYNIVLSSMSLEKFIRNRAKCIHSCPCQ